MKYTEKEKEFIEQRSKENLVDMYREELLRVIGGEDCIYLISSRVRKRMREYGILKKFGNRYEVTPLGVKMLSEEKG